ncbi:MAG: hypothetical protein ACOVOD_08280 [Rhodoferax sp.]|jgi:hypothetical protein
MAMTPAEAKQIIDVLASGVDPATGEVLPEDNPLNSPHVIRALFIASKALERAAGKSARASAGEPTTATTTAKAGKPWSDDEDQRLLADFDAGTPVAALALAHERSSGAINSRLVRLGRLQLPAKAPGGETA